MATWGLATHLIHEVYGNPFSPAPLDRAWLTSDVIALATAIHDQRAFERMPELADALERVGCDNEEVLSHCRQSGGHVRGCWLLDAILGK